MTTMLGFLLQNRKISPDMQATKWVFILLISILPERVFQHQSFGVNQRTFFTQIHIDIESFFALSFVMGICKKLVFLWYSKFLI